MKSVTLKDMAARLQLSPSTVSRALRDHPDISQETKDQVMAMASELDYHPNTIALSLKSMKTRTIGVIVPEIRHDFFSFLLDGIEDVAYNSDYTIIVSKSNENVQREIVNTRSMISNHVAGLIVSISQNTDSSEHFQAVQKRHIPLVFLDRVRDDLEVSKVVVDDFQGAYLATSHLIEAGYKRIAHIAGPKNLSVSKERVKGYCHALEKFGIPYREDYVVHCGMSEEDGILGFRALRRLAEMPEAIFTVNDPVAIGVYMELKSLGLRIPDDMAIVGFSDNPIASLVDPPMTTVSQPAYEMGSTAARILLEEIESQGKSFTPRLEILPTKLIVRKSSRAVSLNKQTLKLTYENFERR